MHRAGTPLLRSHFAGAICEAAILTDHAVTSSHPGDLEPVAEEEYVEAVRLADAVLSWAADTVSAAAADGQDQ